MAKKFDKNATQKTNWQDHFKHSNYKEWKIDLNKNSGRIELRKDNQVVYSTASTEACKNYAAQNYNVPLDKWN